MKKLLAVFAFAVLVAPSLTFAAYWDAGENVSFTTLQAAALISGENLYLAGNSVTVSAEVSGDVFAIGNSVSITGSVAGDIMAAASLVNISEAEAQDVRVAGSSVNLSGNISGELMAAGAQILVLKDTNILQKTYLTASNIIFNGNAGGDVALSGEIVEFNGTAEKDLIIKTSRKLIMGPNASVKGDLKYSSPRKAQIDPAAQISGEVIYTPLAKTEARHGDGFRAALLGLLAIFSFAKFAAILLAAYLIWYLRRDDSVDVIKHASSKFGTSLIRGFVFLVVVPAAMIVASLTVLGFPIAIFAGLVYAAILLLASPFSVLLISSLIRKRSVDLKWHSILLGALLLTVINFIPFIGWGVTFVIYLAALGSMIMTLQKKFKR